MQQLIEPEIDEAPRFSSKELAASITLNRRQFLSFAGFRQSEGEQPPAAGNWLTLSRRAMACLFEVVSDVNDDSGVQAATECLNEVDRLESMLSILRPASETNLLNCGADKYPVPVSTEFFALLEFCERLHHETEGAFDITTGALSKCWGFQEGKPGIPLAEPLSSARLRTGFQHISLGEDCTVTLHAPGVRIDFGGVGKGYALDRGAGKMRAHGIEKALLSAGHSSVLALGAGSDGSGWLIGLRHPVWKSLRYGTVRLRSCAMGTSGQEEQCFEAGGRRYGHIIDPRTGLPPRGVLSVSVIADSAAYADALATAFFVGGPELAQRYCGQHPGVIAVMLLERDLFHPLVFGSNEQATVEITHE